MWMTAPPNISVPSGKSTMDKPWVECRTLLFYGGNAYEKSPC